MCHGTMYDARLNMVTNFSVLIYHVNKVEPTCVVCVLFINKQVSEAIKYLVNEAMVMSTEHL